MYIKFNVDPRRGYHPHCPLYNWYLDFDQLSGYADINEELKNQLNDILLILFTTHKF